MRFTVLICTHNRSRHLISTLEVLSRVVTPQPWEVIIVDDDTEEVLIRSFIRHDGGFNHTNFHKAIVSAIQTIESGVLQIIAGTELDNAPGHKPSECDPDPIPIPSEPEQDVIATPAASSLHLQPSPAAAASTPR